MALTCCSGQTGANRPARASILVDHNPTAAMRAAPSVLLFVVHAASALQPVSVQRRAVLGGAAAALVATSHQNANAGGLEQFKTLVDELAALNKAAQTGKATTKTLQKGFVTTVVPLENAARKNPSRAAPGSNLGG